MANRLVAEDIEAGYGAVRVLHGVTVNVEDGESVVLLGSNGNGKSTLIKCIMGIVQPSAGRVFLERDGERIDLVGRSPQDIVALGIALVPEGRRLFPTLSVEENLVLGAFRREARARIGENLEFVFETFPALRRLSWRRERRIPFVQQLEWTDCGNARPSSQPNRLASEPAAT